jgi:ribosomal protein S18 acetylase RimI-like enzyme
MEHKIQAVLSILEILEAQTNQDMQLAYPVINQLRDKLTFDEFLNRVRLAQSTGYKLFYALTGEKAVVGAVGLRILDDLCWGHHIYVDDLVVDESWRRRGIGKKLMKYVEDFAHFEQCQYIRLASGISRTEVHKFYEELGYQKTSFSFALKL